MIDAALKILERLIAFDTTSRKSNIELIDWVSTFFEERGISCSRVMSPEKGKANLIARIGPDIAGGIMLAGHTDVVPIDGQIWSSDPWVLTERDGKFYGRGVADMKGFIALALAQMEISARALLKRPILLALTHDEEVGCLGAPHLIAALPGLAPSPALAIVGEPTSMKVISAHKGMRTFEVIVTGREAHSSQRGQGVSAIAEAVKLMALIAEMEGEAALAARSDEPFDPPGTTLSVGIVEGGTATNIKARQCRFCWDLRAGDDDIADAYEARFTAAAAVMNAAIKSAAPEGGVLVTRRASAPPLRVDRHSDAETFVRRLTGDNDVSGVAFVAEAGLFQRAGIPSVLCGPGSIRQAHQPDEWITREQLQAGAAFLARLAQDVEN